MQALKQSEDALGVLSVYANAVVPDGHTQCGPSAFAATWISGAESGDLYFSALPIRFTSTCVICWRCPWTTGSGPAVIAAPVSLDLSSQVGKSLSEAVVEIHRTIRALVSGARIVQQVRYQHVHAAGALLDVVEKLEPICVQCGCVPAAEQLGIAVDCPYWLFEIVRGNVRELLQLRVGAGQFLDGRLAFRYLLCELGRPLRDPAFEILVGRAELSLRL